MKLDILVRLTPQVTKIICRHMKKVFLKNKRKKERKEIQANMGGDQNPYIKNLTKVILR